MDKVLLEEGLKKGLSTRKLASALSCSQTKIMYWMYKYGFSNYSSTKKKYCAFCGKDIPDIKRNAFCNLHCFNEYKYKEYISRWLKGKESGNVSYGGISSHIRRWCHENFKEKCDKCDWNEINTYSKKTPLNVHHKDGNWKNTVPENLELLCPNCHSLTRNYGSLNKGLSRRGKYKRRKRLIK